MLQIIVILILLALTIGVIAVGIFLLLAIIQTIISIFKGNPTRSFTLPWIKEYRWRNR